MKVRIGFLILFLLLMSSHPFTLSAENTITQETPDKAVIRCVFSGNSIDGNVINYFVPKGKSFENLRVKGFSIGQSYLKSGFLSDQFIDSVRVMNIRNQEILQIQFDPYISMDIKNPVRISSIDLEIRLENKASDKQKYLHSRHWQQIFCSMVINPIDVFHLLMPDKSLKDDGYEYIIICPDMFAGALEGLKRWRLCEGVETEIFTTSEIGITTEEIQNFILNAYNSWTLPPGAVLLAGDEGLIPAPVWNNYCLSDNIYGDMNGDGLPELIISRLPVDDVSQLEMYLNRIFDFETNPSMDPEYYNHPLSATSFENQASKSWMMTEIFNGWYQHEMQKEPVRVFAGAIAPDEWPDEDLYNIFSPEGLGYIPESPGYLVNYGGGNAQMMNDALNDGAMSWFGFTHGNASGWISPEYQASDLQGLTEAPPSFLISIASLTGNFGTSGSDCFAEAYLKNAHGGTGVIAPSEIMYAIGSEYFTVGLLDGIWDDFLPGFSTRFLPYNVFLSQANVSAKLFLEAYPNTINPNIKASFYHLFHYFGAPFVPVFDEVPQEIAISHSNNLIPGQTTFSVEADSGAVVSLLLNEEVNAVMMSTGNSLILPLFNPEDGDTLHVTATKHNHKRYHALAFCTLVNSMENISGSGIISISPNPAGSRCFIKLPGRISEIQSLNLINSFGQITTPDPDKIRINGNQIELDVSGIESGIYILTLKVQGFEYTRKMLIIR